MTGILQVKRAASGLGDAAATLLGVAAGDEVGLNPACGEDCAHAIGRAIRSASHRLIGRLNVDSGRALHENRPFR